MKTPPVALLTLLAVIGITIAAGCISGWQSPQVKLQADTGTKALQLLAGLMFATLVVERVIEVLLGKPREAETGKLEAAADTAAAALATAEAAHFAHAANVAAGELNLVAPPALAPLITATETSAQKVSAAKTITMNWSLLLGFALGAMLSACGIRTLAELWTTVSQPSGTTPPSSLWIFNGLDLFLTAGLISGGSQGLHLLLTTFGTYLKNAKDPK